MKNNSNPDKPASPNPEHEDSHEVVQEGQAPDAIDAPPPSLPIDPPHGKPTDWDEPDLALFEPSREERYDHLLRQEVYPLVEAARLAGLHPAPSTNTLLKACSSGKLESIKIGGRRLTSASAIRRWVIAEQETGLGGR